jgi:3D (Asp-Asp-Asp) domain-containing protein
VRGLRDGRSSPLCRPVRPRLMPTPAGRLGHGLHLVEASKTVSVAHPLQKAYDMPIRARHRRRLRAPAVALLGAVASGVLLVACGAANPPPAAPPGTTRPAPSRTPTSTAGARGVELGIFEVSCHTGKGVTASGRPSSRETVSVDPRVVPLGTRLVIDKVGPRVAADTGGAIRGQRLDIWEPSVAACTRFGRRQLRVWQAP